MLESKEWFGYSLALLGVAPLAPQIALSPFTWTLIFPIIALPALSLMLSIGHLSATGPLLTYRRIAPVAAGIGWALTWFIGERLYVEGLRASETLLYIFFSIKGLDWAVECGHSYNSRYCTDFSAEINMTGDYHHYPDNFWPAQEFNRAVIRGNPKLPNSSHWEPNEWYFGHSTDTFYIAFPNFGLFTAHVLIWSTVFYVLNRLQNGRNTWFTHIFVVFPTCLYIILLVGIGGTIPHFGIPLMQKDLDAKTLESDPADFWADVRGLYRTTLLLMDFSGAFTGLLIFATSKQLVGTAPINPLWLVPMQMIVPAILTIVRSSCEGHVAEIQPGYVLYAGTEETMSFDLLPVCFANATGSRLWAVLYYVAQLLYTSLGPMIVYASFIYQTVIDDVPLIQNKPKLFFAGMVAAFAAPSVLLYMPMGTKIIAFLRFASQISIIKILCYIVIFLVYGWQTVEADILTSESSLGSVVRYRGPTSPIYTVLLFTVIPALLCTNFAAVFDLLLGGNDIVKHIEAGASFIPGGRLIQSLLGYGILFAPIFIVTGFASYTLFNMVVRHKLPWLDALRPSSEWLAHKAVNTARPRPHSLAYGAYNSLFNITYQTALFCLFIVEAFFAFALISMFFLNVLSVIGFDSSNAANDYRSLMLFVFVILHLQALLQMKNTQSKWDTGDRLTIYIGVATMEMAMLNGYLWMFVADHSWGIDVIPLICILCNTLIRGTCICVGIAIRAHLREIARPSRTRDASEIYEVDAGVEMEAEDESPIIFELARP